MTARRVIVLAVLILGAASAAPADRLVTRDGDVIETQGPWEVRGKLVVFKLADGTLASLRLDEADLEASEALARETERQERATRARPEAPAPPPRQAVMVLTDKDVAHGRGVGDGSGEGQSGGEDGDEAAGTPVASSGRGVQVVQWNQETGGETGVLVKGVAQNLGSSVATRVAVNALFYDETGGLLLAREVTLEEGALGPGARREFSVTVPHELVFDEIKFQVTGQGFRSVGQSVRVGPPPEPGDELQEVPQEEPQEPQSP